MQEGNGRSNAHHGLANKGEDGEKGNGLGIKMQHVNLVMGKHCVEEGEERGNQASPQGVNEEPNLSGCPVNGGAGCAGRTLPMASWLSTTDHPTAGPKAGGGSVEDWGFFLSFLPPRAPAFRSQSDSSFVPSIAMAPTIMEKGKEPPSSANLPLTIEPAG